MESRVATLISSKNESPWMWECFRAVALFRRFESVLKLEDLTTDLRAYERHQYEMESGYKVAKRRSIEFMQAIEEAELGAYRLGRRRHPTRLIWSVNPHSLVERLAQADVEMKSFMRGDEDTAEMEQSTGFWEAAGGRPTNQVLTHSDIADDVRKTLQEANRGKGARTTFLTAYQILERLPQRDQLIAERGRPGKDAGVYNAAAGVVRDAIRYDLQDEVEVEYLDNKGTRFEIAGTPVEGGYAVCGLYRLNEDLGEII